MGALALAALGAAWTGCHGTSPGDTEIPGEDATDGTDDATLLPDTFECNPCFQICPCTPGATMYSASSCTTFTCGANGLWGGRGCLGLGCVDAGDDSSDDETGRSADGGHAATEVGDAGDASDGAKEGATDATSDAAKEATDAASSDGTDDVATDGSSD